MFYTSIKMGISLIKGLLTIVLISCFVTNGFTKDPTLKKDTAVKKVPIVDQFYSLNRKTYFWFSTKKETKRAKEWLDVIEKAKESNLVSRKLMTGEIRTAMLGKNIRNKEIKANTDRQLTNLVLSFLQELQTAEVHFEYDGVSSPKPDSVFVNQLMNSNDKGPVSKIVSELDCQDHDYKVLKQFLKDSVPDKNSLKYKSIVLSMNYLKFIALNNQSEYIVANIPEAEVRYFLDNQLKLKMKSVVGKKKNPTPTIASYITNIVTFPFWNVPFSIASKELLPKVQKDESYLERNNFEVVDGKGNVIDDSDLDWDSYTEKNFPYFFRESTGPNNSLGVLKFNLGNPFSIYLHDTNSKSGFAKDSRFLSHGCVRLEKPIELADLLTRGKVNVWELKTGQKDTESKIMKLDQKVPVFIVYMPAVVDGQKVTFLKDVYGLVQ
jgi:murein L,D-transpeptidase YcbB/YkuD